MTLSAMTLLVSLAAPAADPLGAALEGFPYPHPVKLLPLVVERQDLRMAYMDVAPAGAPNGRVAVLLHGKNFGGWYWDRPIRALSSRGWRVVVPDQLGFGKSSKPDIHYSFDLLALETRRLLDALGVEKAAVVGHSMGGMLAVRFALAFPDRTAQLVLEDPIGLEDYRAEGVPYRTVDEWTASQLGQGEEAIRRLYQAYFVRWRPEFEPLVEVAWRQTLGADWPIVARASALTYDMIYAQPVVHDLPRIRVPTLVVVGLADRTAVGKALAPQDVQARLGNYPELGKRTARAIPGAKLVEIEGVGHIPHLEAPDRFEAALLEFLR